MGRGRRGEGRPTAHARGAAAPSRALDYIWSKLGASRARGRASGFGASAAAARGAGRERTLEPRPRTAPSASGTPGAAFRCFSRLGLGAVCFPARAVPEGLAGAVTSGRGCRTRSVSAGSGRGGDPGGRPRCRPLGPRPPRGVGGAVGVRGRGGGARAQAHERPAALGATPAREPPKLEVRAGPVERPRPRRGRRGSGTRKPLGPLRSFPVAARPSGWRQQVTRWDRPCAPARLPCVLRGAGGSGRAAPNARRCVCVSAEKVFASLPQVERGVSKILGGDPKGSNFLYTNGKCVILRNIDVSNPPLLRPPPGRPSRPHAAQLLGAFPTPFLWPGGGRHAPSALRPHLRCPGRLLGVQPGRGLALLADTEAQTSAFHKHTGSGLGGPQADPCSLTSGGLLTQLRPP